ncbi:hypothetical protein DYB35_011433 [Aphanomyces astaci]|uniref:Uncharacterized protein n=1 Tax=Aphanomyces astaci TaxID=112090 RepID=A0A3R7EG26_APHAT|nr:hypothetical protein DYB35_011433 [Aphanomyces astaci]
MSHAVEVLPVHKKDQQHFIYDETHDAESVVARKQKTKLISFFLACAQGLTGIDGVPAKNCLYLDFPQYFRFDQLDKESSDQPAESQREEANVACLLAGNKAKHLENLFKISTFALYLKAANNQVVDCMAIPTKVMAGRSRSTHRMLTAGFERPPNPLILDDSNTDYPTESCKLRKRPRVVVREDFVLLNADLRDDFVLEEQDEDWM